MSKSINRVQLLGHLGKNAETKYTPGGTAVTKFSVATSRRWKDKQSGEWRDETNWSDVVLWNGENVANYLTKGKQVYVEGRLSTRSYDDKDGKKVWRTEIIAEEVILLGGNGEQEPHGRPEPVSMPRSARQQQAAPQQDYSGPPSDDDVPF